jgi:16S rRNA (guanine966-N2)-methyltransferase
MSLRIIGGRFRNRLLKAPKGSQTRPTTAIVRKAVFDICQFQIQDANFLDVFAGSGLMGIEALSRGAAHAAFIDHDKFAIRCIHENVHLLQLEDQAAVIMGDAMAVLKKLEASKTRFQLIYVDPPYGHNTGLKKNLFSPNERILKFLDASPLAAPGAIVFVEEAFPAELKPGQMLLNTLVYKDMRKFGKSVLHQYLKPL